MSVCVLFAQSVIDPRWASRLDTHTQHSFFTILYTKQYYCTMSPFGLPYEHRQTTCLLRRPVCAEFLALLFFFFPLFPTNHPSDDRPTRTSPALYRFISSLLFSLSFCYTFRTFGSEPTTTAILFYFCGICITLVVEACVCVL